MNASAKEKWIDRLCLGGIMVWLLVYSYPYFFQSLSHNAREIQTYNLDSMVMLDAVQQGLKSHWYRIDFHDYGHFWFNLTLLTGVVYSWFAPLTEQVLLFILRLYSLIGGLLTIAITYIFARRYLGLKEAVFAGIAMAFSPRFIEFSNEIKPDSWQIFFIFLSLYFLSRAFELTGPLDGRLARLKASLGFVLAASAAAGAAFGTKYQGMLLIPILAFGAVMVPPGEIRNRAFVLSTRVFVVLAIVLGIALFSLGRNEYPLHVMAWLQSEPGVFYDAMITPTQYWLIQGARVGCFLASLLCFVSAGAFIAGFDFTKIRTPFSRLLIYVGTALSFVLAFAITSPWLIATLSFLPTLYHRSIFTGMGAWFGFNWLKMTFGIGPQYPQHFIAHLLGVTCFVGAGLLLAAAVRGRLKLYHLPFLFVLTFAVIFLGMLVTRINFVTSLYPLPAVPALVLLTALALHEITRLLPRWLDARKAALAGLALTGVFILVQVVQGGALLLQYPLLVTELTPANQKLGAWLIRCVPAKTRTFATAYSYAPPQLTDITVDMAHDYDMFKRYDPKVVVLNLDNAAETAGDMKKAGAKPGAELSSAARYFDTIEHSGAWAPGPAFKNDDEQSQGKQNYQVYVKKPVALLQADCL